MYKHFSTKSKSGLRYSIVVIVLLCVTACAGTGSSSSVLRPIEAGTRVQVLLDKKPIDTGTRAIQFIDRPMLPISAGSDTTGTVANKTVKGGAEGALVGAGMGVGLSLLCGSFFSSCAQTFVGPLALYGGAAGATSVAVGSIRPASEAVIKLSPTDADAFSRAMAEMDFSELQNSIRDQFLRQSDGDWLITDDRPAVTITLGLESLYLSQLDNGELFLNTQTKFQIESTVRRNSYEREFVYSHSGDSRPTDEWFAGNGGALQSEVAIGIDRTVRQMLWALRPP